MIRKIVLITFVLLFSVNAYAITISSRMPYDLTSKVVAQYKMNDNMATSAANPSLVLHFDGVNGSQAFVDAAGTNHFSLGGSTNLTTGDYVFGTASAYFDGVDDYINIGTSTALDFTFDTADFTIDFWIKFKAFSQSAVFYEARTAEPQVALQIYRTTADSKFHIWVNGASRITGTTTPNLGQWYHLAVTRTSGVTRMFLDGTQEGSDYADTNNYIIGANRPMMGTNTTFTADFNGYLDEFRVIKGESLWSTTFTRPSAAWASSGGINRQTIIDSVSGYNLTLTGSSTTLLTYAGVTGQSIDLQNLYYAHSETNYALGNALGNASKAAISFWFSSDTIAADKGLFQFGALSNSNGKMSGGLTNSTKRCFFFSGAVCYSLNLGVVYFSSWHHYLGIFNMPMAKFYIDGALQQISTYNNLIDFRNQAFYIGAYYGSSGYKFDGRIDNVIVMNDIPTDDEIRALYNYGQGTENLVGTYQ